MDPKFYFSLLQLLIHNPEKFEYIQNFTFKPLHQNSNLEKYELKSSKTLLIGIEYNIKINEYLTEPLLLFAQPIEHVLQTHIIFSSKDIICRISYQNKTCLIPKSQLQYLTKEYKILEEIESILLQNYSYTILFDQHIQLSYPNTSTSLHSILYLESLPLSKHYLLTPHINPTHLKTLNEISKKNKEFEITLYPINSHQEYIKHLHYILSMHIDLKTKQFLNLNIIDIVEIDYSKHSYGENIFDIPLLNIETEISLHINTNSSIVCITSEKKEISLPLYLNSKNNYVSIENSNHFKELTGIEFNTKEDKLKEILIKDKYLQESIFCNLYLHPDLENIISSIKKINYYMKPKEFFIQKELFNYHSKFLIEDRDNIKHFNIVLSELISTLKECMISFVEYPKFEYQSYTSKSLFYICTQLHEKTSFDDFYLSLIEIKKIITYFQISKDELFEFSYALYILITKITSLYPEYIKNLEVKNFFDEYNFDITQFMFDMLIEQYDFNEIQNNYNTIISLCKNYHLIIENKTCFSTSQDELFELLKNISKPIENISKLNTKNILLSTHDLKVYFK